jgi:hypothetical protein
MRDHVQTYLDYCRSLGGDICRVETKVDFSDWVPGGYGTADYYAVHFKDASLDVLDYKHGQGVRVLAKDNPQGMLYALGVINEVDHLIDLKTVRIHIVQPRLDHIDTWEVGIDELLVFGEEARSAAKIALTPGAPRHPSEKACRFCKHRAACPEFRQHVLSTVDQGADLQGQALADALQQVPMVKAWVNAIESAAFDLVDHGGSLPGFKLVEGRSVRRWKDEQEAFEILAEHINEPYESKLISVAQAEKALGKKAFAELLGNTVEKAAGKPSLVPDSDKRSALQPVLDGFEAV